MVKPASTGNEGKKNPKPVYTSFQSLWSSLLWGPAAELWAWLSGIKATKEHEQKEKAYDNFNANIQLYQRLKQ